MSLFKGGRGIKAPYETTMVRVPVPLKPLIKLLSENFRHFVALNGLTEDSCLEFTKEMLEASTGRGSVSESGNGTVHSSEDA